MKNNIQTNYYSKTLKVFLQQLPNEEIEDDDKSAELEQIKNTIKGHYQMNSITIRLQIQKELINKLLKKTKHRKLEDYVMEKILDDLC